MKKLLLNILLISLLTGLYGCINDPKLTHEGEVLFAGVPVFSEEFTKEVGKTATTITVKAKLDKENGYKVTERGFIYGLNKTPSLENGGIKLTDTQGTGLGEFTLTIGGLSNNKTYYIRAYAENKKGTGYGPEFSVWTNEGIAQVSTLAPNPDDIRSTFAIVGGQVSVVGEGDIFQLGFYVNEKDNSAKIDTIYYYDSGPREMKAEEKFFCRLYQLKPATCYDVHAFVKNDFGEMIAEKESFCTWGGIPDVGVVEIIETGFTEIKVSSHVSDGGDTTVHIAERGFCWSAETTPFITDHPVDCGAGAGDFSGIIDGLESDKQYYVRAYAKSDKGIVGYGEVKTFQTSTSTPTVKTEEVEVLTILNGGADVRGIITKTGQSPVIASGICWSTNPEPTTDDRILPLPSMGGLLAGRLTGLKGGATYYICAYATNSFGTGYGEVKQFTTPSIFTTGLSPFPGGQRVANTVAYFAIGTHLYILGGDMGSNYTNELRRYVIGANGWEPRWPFSDSPMKWQSGVSYGQAAFVYGGYSGLGDEKPGIYEYDEPLNQWYYHNGPDSSIVNSVLGYSDSHHIIYIGGKYADNTPRDDVWSFEPYSKIWQRKTDFPTKQYGGVAVVMDGKAYAGMGKISEGVCNDSIWTSDDGALTWNYRTSYPDAGVVRGGVVCNDRLYIVTNDYFSAEYNPVANVWTKKSKIPGSNLHCIYSIGNKIYMGFGNPITFIVYDPSWDN